MIVSLPAYRRLAQFCDDRCWRLELSTGDGVLRRIDLKFDGKLLMTQKIRDGDLERAAHSLYKLLTIRPEAETEAGA